MYVHGEIIIRLYIIKSFSHHNTHSWFCVSASLIVLHAHTVCVYIHLINGQEKCHNVKKCQKCWGKLTQNMVIFDPRMG